MIGNSLEPKVTRVSIRVPRTFCEQTENTKWNISNRVSTVASRRRRLGDFRSGLIRVDCLGLITSSRAFLATVSRSEERRVGKAVDSTCRFLGFGLHLKKKKI